MILHKLGANLKALYESLGPEECLGRLREGLSNGSLKPEHFSLREMAVSFCGYDWYNRLNPANIGRFYQMPDRPLTEAGEAVDVSAFSNITGQILYTKIMDGWKRTTADAERLCSEEQTMFDGEKIPWLANLTPGSLKLRPGQPYPQTSFGERYIETPSTDKYGEICSVTKEMIFFDRTGQALRSANQVGEDLGYRKAKQIFDTVLGIDNSYKLNGSSYNTYLASGGWVNMLGSWPLNDWTSVNKVYELAANNLDPDTGIPIEFDVNTLFVMPARVMHARRVISATSTVTNVGGFATSGNLQRFEAGNPLDPLEVITSKLAFQRLLYNGGGSAITQTNGIEYWYVGDFKKAFVYRYNWPITVVQAPPNNQKDFEQDIVVQVKGSERGVISVDEPRCVFKFYNA